MSRVYFTIAFKFLFLLTAKGQMPNASESFLMKYVAPIAELETIYQLTHKMKQPYYVIVKKARNEPARFEPMKGTLVQKRLHQLKMFYQ